MTRTTMWALLPAALALVSAGCSTVGGTATTGQQQRVIQDASPEDVLTAAAAILQREFGRVRVDQAARRITTAPTEYSTDRESGTARDLYRGKSVMRRTATFEVGQRGGVTVARLRVEIERQDTSRQVVMQPESHRLSDAPGHETPIDRDAATTEQQNTVWTKVRRDTKLEQMILEELRERFARLAADAEPAPPAGGPTTQPRTPAP